MRFQSGRWTVVLAAAVVVPSFFLAGCKSGTNLVSLPKMPDLVTWGKKKPSDKDVAKHDASQLPAPPSAAAFAGQDGANSPYGTPRYPNTGRDPVQPAGVPYSPASYPKSGPAAGGMAYGAAGAPDPYSPAYARSVENPNSGSSGGFYGGSPSAYERTASRGDQYGGATYPAPAPNSSYDDRYNSGQYGGQYNDSRTAPNPATQPIPQPYPYSTPEAGGYSRPAGFESAGGSGSADGGYGNSAYDQRNAAGSSYGQSAGTSGTPFSYQNPPACTGDSCTPPGYAAPASSGVATATRNPHYRPGNTGDLDRQQWIPSPTATRSQPLPGEGSSPYGDDALARRTVYEADASSPREESYPAGSGPIDYSRPVSPRDSGYGAQQY